MDHTPLAPWRAARKHEENEDVGLGASIVVFAVGAVLAFAVTVSNSHGVNWTVVGDILMGVGAFGVLLSLFMWGVGPWGGMRRRTTVVDNGGRMVRRDDTLI